MGTEIEQRVHRRRVFYIPGYDPVPPRRYRELYRKEGAEQAKISGYKVDLKPKRTGGPFGWHVESEFGGAPVSTDFEVLVWSDIVRDSMAGTIANTYRQLAYTAWVYIASGALRRLMRLRKGPVIAALYPVAMLLAQLLLAILAGLALARGVMLTGAVLPISAPILPVATSAMAIVLGLSAAILILHWFRARDGKFLAYYLIQDYAFTAKLNGANPPEMEKRLAEFGDLIAAALREDVDEVLLVGHSSGAHMGVSVLAELIRSGRVPDAGKGPVLGFLSLGQVVPMVSFLPEADWLRADLQYLSARDDVTWVDVSAPGDGCAFALCDPVAVSGVAPDTKKWPLVLSAAFSQTLSPARWKALRWKFFRLHFQYLCAFDQPADYDYFRITAGPQTLAQRYANRAPSQSRIDLPVSKYTSVRAA